MGRRAQAVGARWWAAAARRTISHSRDDGLTDWAAVLTFYGILALFPALLVLVSILGVIGGSVTQPLLDNLATTAPGPARDILVGAVEDLQQGRGAAGALLVVALATALWSASAYIAAFMRATNAVYGVGEGRPLWKRIPRTGVPVANRG